MSETENVGRRVLAALDLAGRSRDDVAAELNISGRTLARVIAGERQAREWELSRLADVLGVPEWFLVHGFEGAPSAVPVDEDRDAAARRHDELIARLDQQGELLRTLMARVADVTERSG